MDRNEIKVSVCSPVYNERENIAALVNRVHDTMVLLCGIGWEQILVNDGSRDGSGEVIANLTGTYPHLVAVEHETNLGEGAGWSTAFSRARGEVIVILAADLQSQPEDIPRLLDIVFKEGFDVGTGERRQRKDEFYYWCATRILNFYMSLVFNVKVKDVSSSFFAVRSSFVKGLALTKNDHRYILPILTKRGARIKEIPVEHQPRFSGISKYTRLKVFWAIPEVLKFTLRCLRGNYKKSLAT